MATVNTKRYIPYIPRAVPAGKIVVHNHVRPEGFPNVPVGWEGFRVWLDVPTPKDYRVTGCRCGWAPHLKKHYRVVFAPKRILTKAEQDRRCLDGAREVDEGGVMAKKIRKRTKARQRQVRQQRWMSPAEEARATLRLYEFLVSRQPGEVFTTEDARQAVFGKSPNGACVMA